jgi:hypothetical protein
MDWKHLLAYITGTVDQELLLRNESLVTENCILRNQIQGRVRLSDGERKTLAAIGKQLSKQALTEVATIVTPDTILVARASTRFRRTRNWWRTLDGVCCQSAPTAQASPKSGGVCQAICTQGTYGSLQSGDVPDGRSGQRLLWRKRSPQAGRGLGEGR